MRVIIPVNCPHIYTTAAIVGKIVNPLIYVGCFTSTKLGNFSRKKKIINDVIHVLLINTMQCLHFAMAANGGHVTLKWLASFLSIISVLSCGRMILWRIILNFKRKELI